ncbi:hypothetical protein ACWC2H_10325 [Streptomyces sp. 900105755]
MPEIIAPRRPADAGGPHRTRIDGTDPELMERLTRQVLGPGSGDMVDALVEQVEDGTDDVVAALLAPARNGGAAGDLRGSALVRADSAGGAWLGGRVWTTNGGCWTGRRTGRGCTVAR